MLLIASENILLTFFKNYNLIRISRDDYRELNKLNEKFQCLKKYQRTVTDQEISEYTGYSVDKIREIKRRELTFISLNNMEKIRKASMC